MPTPEICDGVDNDCNGAIDDGDPALAEGTPFAAELLAVSAPATLISGQMATATVTFQNIGSQPWLPNTMWVVADGAGGEDGSPFHDGFTWSTTSMVFSIHGT